MLTDKSNWVTATKIYKLRMGAGLSQADLAAKLGIDVSEVGRWEKGMAPDDAMMAKIAETLGASLDELTG